MPGFIASTLAGVLSSSPHQPKPEDRTQETRCSQQSQLVASVHSQGFSRGHPPLDFGSWSDPCQEHPHTPDRCFGGSEQGGPGLAGGRVTR